MPQFVHGSFRCKPRAWSVAAAGWQVGAGRMAGWHAPCRRSLCPRTLRLAAANSPSSRLGCGLTSPQSPLNGPSISPQSLGWPSMPSSRYALPLLPYPLRAASPSVLYHTYILQTGKGDRAGAELVGRRAWGRGTDGIPSVSRLTGEVEGRLRGC